MSKNQVSRRTFLKGMALGALAVYSSSLPIFASAENVTLENAAEVRAESAKRYGDFETDKQTVYEIAPKTWCLAEFGLVSAFLIEGEEKAALIDTCCGLGNIREVVESLTKKPVIVLLTHGHSDHTAGLYHFRDAEVYLNEKDKGMKAPGNSFRESYAKSRAAVRFPGHEEDILACMPIPEPEPAGLENTLPMNEGDVIDLGGVKLVCYETPGHTDGSVCYLCEERRVLFSGDTVNNSIILRRQPNNEMTKVAEYHETCKRLWELSDRYDVLAPGHEGAWFDKQMVKDFVDLTAGLLDGSIVGGYEEYGIRAGDVARLGLAELWYQCDK